MCGRSGVGRRNAVSIVSALHHAKLITLKMGKNYGLKQFKQEVKNAMQIAGVENEQVFFASNFRTNKLEFTREIFNKWTRFFSRELTSQATKN